MKLALLGYPINHSLSPKLYRELLGPELISYELYSFPSSQNIPLLSFFSERLDGLNITSPYKTHFFHDVEIKSDLVKSLGAINTLAFTPQGVIGTNTDVLAVVDILENYKKMHNNLEIILLGDGVMANLTLLVASQLKIPIQQFSRKMTPLFANLDLTQFEQSHIQSLVINSCSRDFVFNGKLSGREIFWDYNYSFLPHQNSLPSQVLLYKDGREMLELQAKAAIKFWKDGNT